MIGATHALACAGMSHNELWNLPTATAPTFVAALKSPVMSAIFAATSAAAADDA